MFFVTVLGSGSAGNCALIETPQTRLLVDAGLSARQTAQRLAACGINPLEIDGILLTHEHGDHAGALEVWCKQWSTPVYCNRTTGETLQRNEAKPKDWRWFPTGSTFSIKDITIETFPVPHDAVDPVGFVLHSTGATLGVLTDLGKATKLAIERVRQADTLLIETNHDEKLLQNCTKRPWSVKQRIMSQHGHLSNGAAANVIAELLAGGRLRRTVLGHLSRDCNSPELAIGAVRSRLEAEGVHGMEVLCATQREITPRFAVAGV
jgi:phosphoribosyl 1,2-cyclic phosphodiesterase